MLLDGQKWACSSCIRGHRVSNCTHADRELFVIAPKGRPVKQCEHCRSARKDKSHHAKCNCGSKKHKDTSQSGSQIEAPTNVGCRCHQPDNQCVCGNKSEADELRLQETLLRKPVPVQSRPTLDTRSTDSALLTGHPKLQHRNTLGHTSCQPYNKPKRPTSLHAPSYTSDLAQDLDLRATDDLQLFNNGSNRLYGALSSDNLLSLSPTSFEPYDIGTYLNIGATAGDNAPLFRTSSTDALTSQPMWYDTTLSTVTETPGDFITSPTNIYGESDWNIPSATSESFSPADLPLISSVADLRQPISHSGESNHPSVPGLTASSSGAQSEIDVLNDTIGVEAFPSFWTDSVQFRETTPVSGTLSQSYAFPSSLPGFSGSFKAAAPPRRHRQTYSDGAHHHVHNSSGSTTVPDDFSYARSNTGVNIGHLQNLATLKVAREAAAAARAASSSPSDFPDAAEADIPAITIPSGDDYYDEFDYPIQPPQPTAESRGYDWLLDRE